MHSLLHRLLSEQPWIFPYKQACWWCTHRYTAHRWYIRIFKHYSFHKPTWHLQTISASWASRSTTFPFPSSPHCAPSTTVTLLPTLGLVTRPVLSSPWDPPSCDCAFPLSDMTVSPLLSLQLRNAPPIDAHLSRHRGRSTNAPPQTHTPLHIQRSYTHHSYTVLIQVLCALKIFLINRTVVSHIINNMPVYNISQLFLFI